jgi:transcription elongation factor Elf1
MIENDKKLEIFKGKVVCPRCNGNGLVYKAKIKNFDKIILICDECDASWKENTKLSMETFEDLSTYLERIGSSYKEAVIIDLGYNWYLSNK